MKKLLLAGVFAVASFPGYAAERETHTPEEYSCHERGYRVNSPEFNKCMEQYDVTDEELCTNYYLDVHPNSKDDAEYKHCLKRLASGDKAYRDFLACARDDGKPVCGTESLEARAQVTIRPPYQGPPPIGWVYGPYTQCADPPRCAMGMVSVAADGLNVRVTPNGPAVMALVNGVPLIPVTWQGPWILVAAGCDLTPTFASSWTAGVPLNRCWVYF
jgi:hypothetical protein